MSKYDKCSFEQSKENCVISKNSDQGPIENENKISQLFLLYQEEDVLYIPTGSYERNK